MMIKGQIRSELQVFLLIIGGAIPAASTPNWAPQSPIFSAEDHIDEVVEAVRCFDKLKLARDVHLVDLFGGHGALSKAWSKNKHGTVLFDTAASGEDHNIISRDGFFRALGYTLRLVKGGLLAGGPPCSLFVWISSSIHKRTKENCEGDETNPKVRQANLIVYNVLVLSVVAVCRQCEVFMEQPSSSRMFGLKKYDRVKNLFQWSSVFTWMSCFGHVAPKPSILQSSMEEIESLKKKRKRRTTQAATSWATSGKRLWFRDSKGWVSGGKGLSKSARYTTKFANEVHKVWLKGYNAAFKQHRRKEARYKKLAATNMNKLKRALTALAAA